MQRRGGKKKFDNHDIERQAAGFFAEKFPALESMVIRIIYYQKGDNPILMSRTLHVYPEDFAYFHIPCLIHDCVEGSFEIAPIVMNILKTLKGRAEGRLECKGSLNKDLSSDHGYIEYTIEVTYKSGRVKPDVIEKKTEKEKEQVVEKTPEKEVIVKAPAEKQAPAEPVKEAVNIKQKTPVKTSAKKPEAVGGKVKAKSAAVKKSLKKSVKKTVATVKSKTVASKSKVAKTSKPPAKKEPVKTKKVQKAKASTIVKKSSSKAVKKKKR